MLTTLCWVPKGKIAAVPFYSNDKSALAHLKERMRDEEEQPDGSHPAAGEDDSGNEEGETHDGNVIEDIESEDESEVDDVTIRDSDLVFAAARAADDESALELYVYDEPKDNIYLHHDAPLCSFPLCSSWLTDGNSSMLALGTMMPFIEIWPLECMDAVEPAAVLGGCVNFADNFKKRLKKDRLHADSHTSSVLAVEWNVHARNILASAGADNKLKLWDLNATSCVGTYEEPDKVQSLSWHPEEAHLLLSAGYDQVMVVRDCRTPDQQAVRFPIAGQPEHVHYYMHAPMVIASSSGGCIEAFDVRQNGPSPVWSVQAHDADTTFDCSRHVAGLMVSGGRDGKLSLWDLRGAAPREIVSRTMGVGSVLAATFHPNCPDIVAACGTAGKPLIYTTTRDLQ